MSFLQTVITEILIMYLTYWTETKYVYAYTYSSHNTTKYNLLFKPTTNNSHNYHSYPSPITSIRRKSTIIQNFTKNHPRTYSSSHHVNHQSLHTHTHTHDMKIKLNRVKKKETQLNSSKIHRIYTGARALSKRLIE